MKLKLQYNGFCLRADTDFINRSPGAELFLQEMGIDYTVEFVGEREVLTYATNPDINVPWYSEHMYMDMAGRYGCVFIVSSDKISVSFE